MKRRWAAGVVVAIFLVGCAAGPNDLVNVARAGHEPAGFWLGLWHGMIAVITFIVSLFNSSVNVYEVHNSGWPYNLGFVLGLMMALGGGGGGAARRRKRDYER